MLNTKNFSNISDQKRIVSNEPFQSSNKNEFKANRKLTTKKQKKRNANKKEKV